MWIRRIIASPLSPSTAQSIEGLWCLEPMSHLSRILAIGVAEFPGEIRLFTGNDPIAQHQYCGHNQEQYPQGIDQQRYANVQQCQCDIDRIATVAERSLSNQRCG